ncbi:MAG TPA: NAD(P)H-hydrate epimerase, partial [Edaphobacter sp.]|nr:NAD(P)H-hydrate epimerase [Edaphobacter sp.]
MKILTAEEMGATDRRTVEESGISLETLMEGAGRAVAEFCLRQYGGASQVIVLCGRGNNSGDGLVAARVLAQAGLQLRVLLLGRIDEVKGEAAAALRRLRCGASSVVVDEVVNETSLQALRPVLAEAGLLLDAVVGTGFKPPLRGLAVSLRNMVEELDAPVVAVDLPSGWDANSMEQTAAGSFRADAVVTFTAPKVAHVFGHLTRNERTGGTFGPVVVAGIGSPESAVISTSGLSWTGI